MLPGSLYILGNSGKNSYFVPLEDLQYAIKSPENGKDYCLLLLNFKVFIIHSIWEIHRAIMVFPLFPH